MIFKKIDYETILDMFSYKISIIISGETPELMIAEICNYSEDHDEDEDEINTVQVSSEATEALYLALHKIYSAKP
jgi:hypothetical protein